MANTWQVKVRMELPVFNEGDPPMIVDTVLKRPGDLITQAEWDNALHSKEQVKALIDGGAVEEG